MYWPAGSERNLFSSFSCPRPVVNGQGSETGRETEKKKRSFARNPASQSMASNAARAGRH